MSSHRLVTSAAQTAAYAVWYLGVVSIWRAVRLRVMIACCAEEVDAES
jgi:hypothetical protein